MVLFILGEISLIIGALFLFLSALGLIRMPDVYNRMQAGTKGTTFGAFFSILGVMLIKPAWFIKGLSIIIFILLTNPLSSHALLRATHRLGIPLAKKAVDAYQEDKEKGLVEK